MKPNPYASPVETSDAEVRWPFLRSLSLLLGLFLLFSAVQWTWGSGFIFLPQGSEAALKILLSESAVVAALGAVSFSALVNASGKPARLMRLGRAICIAHLIVTGTMLPMLLRLRWHAGYTPIVPTIAAFGWIELTLLHFALRRFEQSSRLANWTLGVIVVVAVGAVAVPAVYIDRRYGGPTRLAGLIRLISVQPGLGLVCVLEALRVLKIHRSWQVAEPTYEPEQAPEECN